VHTRIIYHAACRYACETYGHMVYDMRYTVTHEARICTYGHLCDIRVDTYTECVLVLFLVFTFYSDYHPGLYGDMAITEKPETAETQKYSYSTQEGQVTVQKCPHIYF